MLRAGQRRLLILAAAGLLLSPTVPAATDDEPDEEKPRAIVVGPTEQVVVIGDLPSSDSATLDRSVVASGRSPNLGLAVRSIPGVEGVRRGPNAAEPVIRGLGWERVRTVIDGIPLHGACPARMDPPASTISSGLVQRVDVIKGLAPVSLGPPGTAGRISIATDYDRGATAGRELQGWFGATHDTARRGLAAEIGAQGGTRRVDLRAGLESLRHGDYESAEGIEVPGGQAELGGFLSLGFRPSATRRWTVGVIAKDGEDIDFPALPMNAEVLDDRIFRVGYCHTPRSGRIAKISARIGAAAVDHRMSNRGKPNRPLLEAETDSSADTLSARLAVRLALSPRLRLEIGGDHVSLDRDALRERHLVASGMTSLDHIWPDVGQTDTGLFAELRAKMERGLALRAGLRVDRVRSEALAADDPSLQGMTVREQWVAFYGPGAGTPNRDETLVSGNLQLERNGSGATSWFAGVGLATRAASVTERFFAFAPAPGGYLVGNPALDAEAKREVVLGGRLRRAAVRGALSVFLNDFDDYIHRYTAAMIDVNGDAIIDRVRGFENVDARLYGGELSLVLALSDRWSVPLSLCWVHAGHGGDDRPLPEIPPLEATLAARARLPGRFEGWVEVGGRFVDRQHRVDFEFPEDETPGFGVFHLRARSQATRSFAVEIGVENLFDTDYHEHLTREALLAVGGLEAGGEIPQSGRSAYVTTRATF